MKALALPLLALVALAACDSGTQSAPEQTASDSKDPGPVPEPPVPPAAQASEIPAAIRGRWGLVPADCTSTRGDAKGLLTVSANQLAFYESVGTLGAIGESAPTRLRAAFAFEGEGMSWQRDMVLDVQDDGATLIRREYGDDAAPGPFRYTKCS